MQLETKRFIDRSDYDEKNVDRIVELCYEGKCSIELLIHHLHTNFSKNGVRSYIINNLFDTKISELMFYVPEIVYMALRFPESQLEKLVVSLCGRSTEFFLLSSWILDAWSHDLIKKKQMKKSCENISKDCELKWLSSSSVPEVSKAKTDFYGLLNIIVRNLTAFSLYLKKQDEKKRKNLLKILLRKLNNLITNKRKEADPNQSKETKVLTEGIIVPFSFSSSSSSCLVVGILEDEVQCFETKKRCPYKVVFECINPNELSTKRINQSLEKIFTISDEEEKEIADFKSDEIKVDMKDFTNQSLMETRFVGLDNFAQRAIRIEKKLENEHTFQPSRESLKVNAFAKRRTLLQEEEHLDLVLKDQKLLRISNLHFSCGKLPLEEIRKRTQQAVESTYGKRSKSEDSKQAREVFLRDKLLFLNSYLIPQPRRDSQKYQKMFGAERTELDTELQKINLENKKKEEQKSVFESRLQKKVFIKLWKDKFDPIRKQRAYGHFSSYSLKPVIIKGGDDLRQEIVAMQLMKKFNEIFQREKTNCYLRPYEIVVTSHDSGFLEFLSDTIPIDNIKKIYKQPLEKIYRLVWGKNLENARKNFIESLAGYSLYTYLLQIKDRHNGNIMISHEGHILHIDFGFLFTTSPGKINFENAPFKFTAEYVELLGGVDSDYFRYFTMLVISGLIALQRYLPEIMNIVKIMSYKSLLPCFEKIDLEAFADRFKPDFNEEETTKYAKSLITDSMESNRTVWYDEFQKLTNKIEP